jgi:TRAP-type mannitol/chloroaromatic compound transport system permease small subunit
MPFLLRTSAAIDWLSERVGRAACWLTLAMIAFGAYNAVARYAGRYLGMQLSSNALIEAQWYLFSAVFLLAAAYALRHDAHVRVDVLYGRLSRRARAWIDLAGGLVFLLPFCAFMLWVTWRPVLFSWSILEGSPDPGGLPRYPIKTLVPVAFALLALQGVSQVIKSAARLRGALPLHPHEEPLPEGI